MHHLLVYAESVFLSIAEFHCSLIPGMSTGCLAIFLMEGPLGCFQLLVVVTKGCYEHWCKGFCINRNGDVPGMNSQMYVQLLVHVAIASLVTPEAAKLFAGELIPLCIPTCKERVPVSASLPCSVWSLFLCKQF